MHMSSSILAIELINTIRFGIELSSVNRVFPPIQITFDRGDGRAFLWNLAPHRTEQRAAKNARAAALMIAECEMKPFWLATVS